MSAFYIQIKKPPDDKEYSIKYSFRKVRTIPYGINRSIHSSVIPFIQRAVKEMAKCNYWSSRFINYYLIYKLSKGIKLELITKSSLRSTFLCIAKGSKSGKFISDEVKTIKEEWIKTFDCNEPYEIVGLNTITTKTYEKYWNAFEQYHTYAIVDHLGWLIRYRNKELSVSESTIISKLIANEINIKKRPNTNLKELLSHVFKNKNVETILNKELKWCKDHFENNSNINSRIKFHYEILKALQSIPEAPLFKIAPLCSTKLPFIELCQKSLCDLYSWCISKKNKTVVKEIDRTNFCNLFWKKEHVKFKEIFNDNGLKRRNMNNLNFDYGPTLTTDGIQVHIPWESPFIINKKVTKEQYEKHLQSSKDYEIKKQEKISKQLKENGKVDKRTTNKKKAKILPPSCERLITESLQDHSFGMFHSSCLKKSTICDGTSIVSIDPGHKNVISSSITVWSNDKKSELYDPVVHESISLGDYYEKIGNKRYDKQMKRILKINKMKQVLQELSENSLKESRYDEFCNKMKINLKHTNKLFNVYGTRNHARKRFDRVRQKQSFYSTITNRIAPNPETVIVMGNAKFSSTRVGLSACPIAKITERLSKSRKVVMTPETCTTMRCSCCRNEEVNTISAISTIKKTSKRTGKDYYPKIHGLRHCKKCTKSWNRDFNAARNIFFMFQSLMTEGIRASYLKRKFTGPCSDVKVKLDVTSARSVQPKPLNTMMSLPISVN